VRWDVVPYNGEADMLECRLVELAPVPDLIHVLVEADVTHGGNTPKPYRFDEQQDRFEPWADRIRYVRATGLTDSPDAWDREHAQREFAWEALHDADPDDIVLHGDIDEIPTVEAATYVNPRGFVVFMQRMHPFAVDWLHPDWWPGTVAGRVRDVGSFAAMRDARLTRLQRLPDAGWHFSWVGDEKARARKIDSFCHPEIRSTWEPRLEDCYSSGLHVDGQPLAPVVVDEDWPRWILERRCPQSWFRPAVSTPRPVVEAPPILKRVS
jgi:hypothetical protein